MSIFDIACWVVAVMFAAIVNLWIIKIWVGSGSNRGAPPPYPPEDKNAEFDAWRRESDDGSDEERKDGHI